jgi:hypothetical protein
MQLIQYRILCSVTRALNLCLGTCELKAIIYIAPPTAYLLLQSSIQKRAEIWGPRGRCLLYCIYVYTVYGAAAALLITGNPSKYSIDTGPFRYLINTLYCTH